MRIIAMIPARYASSRFPGKLMKPLGNKSVIRHTYDNTVATRLFDEVWVVTDSDIIYNEITGSGGNARMSAAPHESGSDRIAEAIAGMDIDVVVNVQGDEPFIDTQSLQQLIALFEDDTVEVGSIMRPIESEEQVKNPNCVKVVTDLHMNSLLFSRSVIPFLRNKSAATQYYEHVGIYAFKKDALLQFTQWPITPLEDAEKIECLRFLEHGIPLRMTISNFRGVGIDTPEDLKRAIELL
ncbi:MAG: 3-deoxy-manno-octulosonate cytidylyltransferase [Chitinophagaceae bacterium]|nr:3-deoxy-manno-octulosonate cytidylyltransferase [Chitinophagaceae bacterium]